MDKCQWCNSTDIYEAGHSPLCVETQYKCRNCGEDTWASFEMKTKRVGNWVLEWSSNKPYGVWAVPEYHKTIKLTDHGVMYDDGTMGWNSPESTPASVRNAAPQFIRKCQGKRVTR